MWSLARYVPWTSRFSMKIFISLRISSSLSGWNSPFFINSSIWVPGTTCSVRRRIKSGLIALMTLAVSNACWRVHFMPPNPGITYSLSSIPACLIFRPALIWSSAVTPLWIKDKTSSQPLSMPMWMRERPAFFNCSNSLAVFLAAVCERQ